MNSVISSVIKSVIKPREAWSQRPCEAHFFLKASADQNFKYVRFKIVDDCIIMGSLSC